MIITGPENYRVHKNMPQLNQGGLNIWQYELFHSFPIEFRAKKMWIHIICPLLGPPLNICAFLHFFNLWGNSKFASQIRPEITVFLTYSPFSVEYLYHLVFFNSKETSFRSLIRINLSTRFYTLDAN